MARAGGRVGDKSEHDGLPVALTIGEPAGIGPDVTLLAWAARKALRLPPFYLLGDPALIAGRAKLLGLDIRVEETEPRNAAAVFGSALPVAPLSTRIDVSVGVPDPANGQAIVEAIARGVGDIRAGLAAAIVTNPISKKTLYDAGFRHPGHTEFLGTLSSTWTGEPARPVMMMAGPDLRTVPVTIHIPLRDVAGALTTDLIVQTGRTVAGDLSRRFAVAEPRLGVAGLNPHAGEGGTIGDEDDRIVRPAVEQLVAAGIRAAGPRSADAMFHPHARAEYDAALCMYHDQALIPAKTVAFAETVNVTLGLAFVRTSPDHGTAFDIAGTGKADPASLAAALRLAATLERNERAV